MAAAVRAAAETASRIVTEAMMAKGVRLKVVMVDVNMEAVTASVTERAAGEMGAAARAVAYMVAHMTAEANTTDRLEAGVMAAAARAGAKARRGR